MTKPLFLIVCNHRYLPIPPKGEKTMPIEDDIEKEIFKMHLIHSLTYIETLEHKGYFRNKPKIVVLQELEDVLLEEAMMAGKRYYEATGNQIISVIAPVILGLFVAAISIFCLSERGLSPVAALWLISAGIILFAYSFVLILSLEQPSRDAVTSKKTANLALRVLDVYEGRTETLSPTVYHYIQQWLTPEEQEEICKKLNKAIARLQLG